MRITYKLAYGFSVLALGATSVSVTAMHAPVETGQIRDKGKPNRPTTKTANPTTTPAAIDNDLCGLPYTAPCRSEAVQKQGEQPTVTPTAAEVETGQLLDKGPRPWDKPKSATNPTPPTPTAAEVETGQLLDKGPRPWDKPKSATNPTTPTPTAAEVETGQLLDKGPRPWDKPKSAAAQGTGSSGRTFLFAALGALAAIGGIFVAAGGDDTPTSP